MLVHVLSLHCLCTDLAIIEVSDSDLLKTYPVSSLLALEYSFLFRVRFSIERFACEIDPNFVDLVKKTLPSPFIQKEDNLMKHQS